MVKISIISGFLGAGKTTFIKKLLNEDYFGTDSILIENDYGSLGIDSLVMEKSGITIKEMNSGCICCSLIGNFILSLEELIEKENPKHIIIEPSGVGKLSEILNGINDLNVPYELASVITIVDAKRFDYNNTYVSEYFWDQICNANTVVISKTDKLSGKKLLKICDSIHQKTSNTKIICVPWENNYKDILNNIDLSESYKYITDDLSIEDNDTNEEYKPMMKAPIGSMHSSKSNNKIKYKQKSTGIFESWSTETSVLYSRERIIEILNSFEQSNRYGIVVRAKGILNTPTGSLLINYVPEQEDIHDIKPDGTGRILVIGMNLNRSALDRLFLT